MSALTQHRMRAYFVPAAAGITLAISSLMPWVFVGDMGLGGVPELAGLWILALGMLATLFATLSIITRKNSRHPLLVVGLAALGILLLSCRLLIRTAGERAWAASQAMAIVHDMPAPAEHQPQIGVAVYVGLVASAVLVLFGLTMVLRRVQRPYAEPDDDVE
ncbi:MAG: hypothetical protein HYX76_01805 [Acidobacteria bacterium]|nr:hypothetical protein [Acidobacteriota bacterium]